MCTIYSFLFLNLFLALHLLNHGKEVEEVELDWLVFVEVELGLPIRGS